MRVSAKHVLSQGPVLAALGSTAVAALRQRWGGGASAGPFEAPGPELSATVPPRPRALINDYLRSVGGDPAAYKGRLPPHLFPQWGFPLLARTLAGVPYPLARILNGGCRMEIRAPLPADEPLHLTARLEGIDDDGRRAVLHQRLVTGTDSAPEALVCDVYGIVPLGGGKGEKGEKTKAPKARVPDEAREVAWWKLPPDAGLEFAVLTGDFNPVHWITPYARAAGFKGTILHGFATLARAVEGLNRVVFAGDPGRLEAIDVRFTRPLVLPARVGLYFQDREIAVGDAPGGPAYLSGTFTPRAATPPAPPPGAKETRI